MPLIATEIINAIMKSHDAVGLLMYGSAVTAADSAADIDVICVTRNDGRRHFMTTVGETNVDVYATTRESLEKSIRSDTRDNNNFILNAFVRGRPLMKLDSSMDELVGIAREVWSAGPRQPDADELKAIEWTLNKGLQAARSYVAREGQSAEWRGIAAINLGQFFLRAMYAYCRTHRLWSSTLADILQWDPDAKYAELISLCGRYVRARSLDEQFAALSELTIRAVVQPAAAAKTAAPDHQTLRFGDSIRKKLRPGLTISRGVSNA